MEPRSFRRIANLSARKKREFISEGLALLAENVSTLLEEAKACWAEAPRASAITSNVAAEEAAKALMLVDYLRPSKGIDNARIAEHLDSVVDHLARGLYVAYYDGRPVDFAEIERYLRTLRAPFYLDGPTGCDWIFRNDIEARREELFYVDVLYSDAGLEWRRPGSTTELIRSVPAFARRGPEVRRICTVLLDLNSAGLLQPKALQILGSLWAGAEIHGTTRWETYHSLNVEFVQQCSTKGLLKTDAHVERIVDLFLFPLTGVELRGFRSNLRDQHLAKLKQDQIAAAGVLAF